jgi:exodeoxyribonuclease V alpha subunit
MLYKNLIYTAITRAKKKVFLFGDPLAFQFAVSNNKETTRNSYLSEQIIEYSTREHEESNHS